MTTDSIRLLSAASLLIAYAMLCARLAFLQIGKRRAALAQKPSAEEANVWTIAFASQTGTAEELAQQTARTLRSAGMATNLCSLTELNAEQLRSTERILFVVSTYGEGDPPDNAVSFAHLLETKALLRHLHYAVLALGDSSYRNFCGFGRALDAWLQQQGAQALYARIDVDCCATAALETWRQHLSHLAGTSDIPDWQDAPYTDWRLMKRVLLNAGSAGAPVYHLELKPAVGMALPDWQSGDLAQLLPPNESPRPREYSIASIPAEGSIHLLVRLHRHSDGTCGIASGWLTQQAVVGDVIKMRLRQHNVFRLNENALRPLILIGNGTGLAGLRGHLKTRAQLHTSNSATRNWLIFGERNAQYDFHYQAEIKAWQAAGVLEKVDMVFSRDQITRCYVQDSLRESGEMLQDWVKQGAAIYVCGSLEGMASGVHQALTDILGAASLERLRVSGRYRRDVY